MLGLRSALVAALFFALAFAGCSAIINPDSDRLGAGPDTGPPPRVDSGTRDAGPPGDGGDCVEGTPTCSGDALVSCSGGMEVLQDCQAARAFCEVDHCEPWVCVPGDRECASDGESAFVCTARGDEIEEHGCGDGFCDPDTNACVMDVPPPVCEGFGRISPGESIITDLCGLPDDNTFERATGCDFGSRAQSGDEIFVLELDRSTRLTFELTDIDTTRAIDTVLYIRRDCEDGESQVACHDDVACGASTVPGGAFCTGGVDVRQSRMTLTLPAGRYYIVVDAFERRSDGVTYSCGRVRLSISPG